MKLFSNVSDLIEFIEDTKRVSKNKDLSLMKHYCLSLGNPQEKLKFIHVTGTNGKGSVVALMDSMLRSCHFNVGCFTSPYITCFNERIRYNNEFISDEDLLKYGNMIYSYFDKWQSEVGSTPTFFEFITLLAFLYFKDQKDLDVVLLEVGIGGRIDPTNVINPLISVITSVSFDHMNLLGNTLQEILIEKLGIVKKNRPVFLNIDDHLKEVVSKKIGSLTDEIYYLDKKQIKILKSNLNGSLFNFQNQDLEISLLGYHQIENAALAFLVIKYYLNNYKKDLENSFVLLSEGLKKTKWQGRLEVISKKPFIICDGAHNVDGIKRVCEFINHQQFNLGKRGIVAISDNKEKDKMIEILDQTFDEIIFTSFTYKRSATSVDLFNKSKNNHKLIIDSIDEINDYLINHDDKVNVFIGSLYFISEVKKYFK